MITYAIVIPTYNEEHSIERLLDSLFLATRQSMEQLTSIFIIDDASTDKTLLRVEAWHNEHQNIPVTILGRSVRSGKINLINFALREIGPTADLLFLFDADVRVEMSAISRILQHFMQDPDLAIVWGGALPDPQIKSWRYAASAAQMRLAYLAASNEPPSFIRAEGKITALRSSAFSEAYLDPRLINDDYQLSVETMKRGLTSHSEMKAIVYAIPASSLRDFAIQTYRWNQGESLSLDKLPTPSVRAKFTALFHVLLSSPLALGVYIFYRVVIRIMKSKWDHPISAQWPIAQTTKRL